MPYAQPITIRMTMGVFIIPDTSCRLQAVTGIVDSADKKQQMAEDPYGYRTRDPVKDRNNQSACIRLDSKYGVLSCVI
jgi:hypothetical protein